MDDLRRPCPTCTRDIPQPTGDDIEQLVSEYIQSLDEDIRADGELLSERIEHCASCDNLLGGTTCKLCGCFVRYRAANAVRGCPAGKWYTRLTK